MEKIYILMSHTGTALSNLIKLYTKNQLIFNNYQLLYTHVSISLDENLNELYSFGRLNPYNPFIGGFVHEKINSGTYKRFKNTTSVLYSVDVEDEVYYKVKKEIKDIEKNKDLYDFNILGLFCVAINKKISRDTAFYCAEFVRYVLEEGGIKLNLPELIKPEDFKKLENKKLIYKGLLRDFENKNGLKRTPHI